jgi:hypothetical protein
VVANSERLKSPDGNLQLGDSLINDQQRSKNSFATESGTISYLLALNSFQFLSQFSCAQKYALTVHNETPEVACSAARLQGCVMFPR